MNLATGTKRQDIYAAFQQTRARGDLLVGAAGGSGLIAEAAERGGADFLFAVNAGRLRLMGAATVACLLPISDSNARVAEFGSREFLNRCSIPVIFGAAAMTSKQSATDIAAMAADLGFDGIANFPSAVQYPPAMRSALEFSRLGFRKELDMLRAARALDLWTVCWVRTKEQARQAAASGTDMVCFDFGWTAGGWHGTASALTLKEAALSAREFAATVRRENPRAFPVVVGGPIENIEHLMPIFRNARIAGYIGGSTLDRLPLEDAVMNQTLRFKSAAAMKRKQNARQQTLIAFGRRLGLLGTSQRMLELYRSLRETARAPARFACAITGEPGSSRQFVAEALFRLGGGQTGQLMTVDAAEMSTPRLMIALFGRQDAARGAAGRADIAGLIVRGLEKLPAHAQRRIARFLAKGAFRPVGAKREERGTLRLLFISSKSIAALSKDGALHPDLFRELQPREITVPALREYVEDIEDIIIDMAQRLTDAPDTLPKLSPAALRRLQIHPWPGNLTELRAFVMRLIAAGATERIDDDTAARLLAAESVHSVHLGHPASERDVILDALWRHGFNRSRTARFLGIARRTLFNKIRRYGLRGA